MDNITLANDLFNAAQEGDFKKFRQCFTTDAVVWHSFDEVDQPVDESIAFLQSFVQSGASLSFRERHYFEIPGGAIVQHNSYMALADGGILKNPTMQRLHIADGKIYRIEEYFDTTQLKTLMGA